VSRAEVSRAISALRASMLGCSFLRSMPPYYSGA
jgi:hypothetical protein